MFERRDRDQRLGARPDIHIPQPSHAVLADNFVRVDPGKDDIYPILHFSTRDVPRVLTRPSSLGLNLRRIEGFLGCSDNMLKIRDINVFPQALAPIPEEHATFDGEFVCMLTRDGAGLLICEAEMRFAHADDWARARELATICG